MTTMWKHAAPGAAALLLALGLAGCSGKADEAADGDARSTAAASDAAEGAREAAARDGLTLLREATTNLDERTYRLVYAISGDEAAMGAIDGTLTVAAAPPKQALTVEGTLGGEEGTLALIDDGTSSFLCVDGGGEKTCLKAGRSGSRSLPLPSIVSIEQALNEVASAPDVTVREVAGQSIAGRAGRCFDVTSSEGDGLVCIDDGDGIVLLVDGDFSGAKGTLRLKEYSEDPPASDFEPPYPVTEFN